MSKKKIWFVCGSQHLYGPQVLEQVETDCRTMAQEIQASGELLLDLEYHTTAKSHGEVLELCQAANVDPNCVGLVLWMHTFSPAKMWIAGLKQLQKPMLHLHTQFNREIPWGEIDMNFMNLNQSAHGGREFGFIASRLGIERPVVVGHYLEARVLNELDEWCRAALAWSDWQGGAFAPFGDNMREVAVTEGNKVNAEIQLGYRVHGFGVGELVKVIDAHSPDGVEVKELLEVYRSSYQCDPNLFEGHNLAALQQAARIELGLRDFLEEGGFKGFTNTFEDLAAWLNCPASPPNGSWPMDMALELRETGKPAHWFAPSRSWAREKLEAPLSWKTTPTTSSRGKSACWEPICWRFVLPLRSPSPNSTSPCSPSAEKSLPLD